MGKKIIHPLWWYVYKCPKPIKKVIQYWCGRKGHIVGDMDYSADGLWSNCKYCNYYFKISVKEFPSKQYLENIYNGEED